MPQLQFVVDKRVIAVHILQNSDRDRFLPDSDFQSVVDFQNAAWKLNEQIYNFLRYGPSLLDSVLTHSIHSDAEQAEKYIEKIILLPEFIKLIPQIEKACTNVRAEWEQNVSKSDKEISSIIGFEVIGEWEVFITHPAIRTGINTGKKIIWSDRNDWPNYNTIYLWHEVLHSQFGASNEEHAIIELIADNELRVRLNGGTYPPFEGHEFLNSVKQELLPDWNIYLAQENRGIREFVKNHSKN